MNKNLFELNCSLYDEEFVIWGGGRVGINLYELLKSKNLCPKAFVDKSARFIGGASYDGINYISPNDFYELSKTKNMHVLIGSDNLAVIQEITKLLEKNSHCGNIYGISNIVELLSQYEDKSHFVKHKTLSVQIHLTEHCNLNCKGCDHFSPIAEKEFLDIAQFEKDLSKLSEIFGESLTGIILMGGEPLLHKDIIKFINIARRISSSAEIKLLSNGILLGSMEQAFWDTCRNNNIILEITKYPIGIDYDYLENKAKQCGVKYQYTNIEPIKTLWKSPLDIEGKQNPEIMFSHCGEANYCISLDSGKLYTCSVAAWIRHFEKKHGKQFDYSESHGIDIYSGVGKDDIFTHLSQPDGLCRYCKVDSRTYNNPWSQSNKELCEWL